MHPRRSRRRRERRSPRSVDALGVDSIRRSRLERLRQARVRDADEVRPLPAPAPRPDRAASLAPRYVKPKALSPQSFGEAKVLADEFKNAVPVIMNLQGVERDLARRLIDFASGICYAVDGGMEKIASQVFLLTPSSVEVSDEDRQRMEQRGYE